MLVSAFVDKRREDIFPNQNLVLKKFNFSLFKFIFLPEFSTKVLMNLRETCDIIVL